MTHPYANLPDSQFWRRGVEQVERHLMNPCGAVRFTIQPEDKIISAGSCFAQVVAKVLQSNGFNYYIPEAGDDLPAKDRARKNYGVYSARYGNLFTPRQLLQLLREAFEGAIPAERVWQDPDGRVLDPYRPMIDPDGFGSARAMLDSRQTMLGAVRDMIRNGNVFVYTLGITECWRSRTDGWVFPMVPGASGGTFDADQHEFVNFGFADALADLTAAFDIINRENPKLKLLLTLSPVQMIATYEKEHVLSASTYCKSVLRAVAGELARKYDWVQYFPSYELMTGSFAAGMYYNDDTRTINDAGVAHVVRALFDNMVAGGKRAVGLPIINHTAANAEVVCDDDALSRAILRDNQNTPHPVPTTNPTGNAMPVTRDDVIWAFKMLLGREPASEDTIQAHLGIKDVDELRAVIMGSSEFAKNAPQVRAVIDKARAEMGKRIPIHSPVNRVDVEVDAPRMAELWQRVKAAWEDMGKDRPHHSVLTSAEYLPTEFADNEAKFWKSGEGEAEQALQTLGNFTDRDPQDMICAEYGCGVGRLSAPLSRHFKSYHAMDISQPHLDLAQARALEYGQQNIQFHNVTNLETDPLPACDLWYSRIVLQHNPPPIIAQIISRAMDALNPGGFAMFQVPVHRKEYAFSIDDYLAEPARGLMEMHCLPQHKVFELLADAGCNILHVREDNSVESPTIYVSMMFIAQKKGA